MHLRRFTLLDFFFFFLLTIQGILWAVGFFIFFLLHRWAKLEMQRRERCRVINWNDVLGQSMIRGACFGCPAFLGIETNPTFSNPPQTPHPAVDLRRHKPR